MTGQVDIYIAPGMISSFAHESKHAYQFEMGFISLNVSRGSKFPLKGSSSTYYSKEDESEAFSRGEIFGQSENLSLDVYADLRDKREVNFINGKKDNLQGWVNVHKAYQNYKVTNRFFIMEKMESNAQSALNLIIVHPEYRYGFW